MIEFKNENDIKYVKVVFEEYEHIFLLESKLTLKGIKSKIEKTLIDECIFTPPKEIVIIPIKEINEENLLQNYLKVNSYTDIGINIKWALNKNINPAKKIEEIFQLLNKFNVFQDNYEIHFKPFGFIQLLNSRLNINMNFKNSDEFLVFLKKYFLNKKGI
ncbi:hypothetical protein [Candidatus Cetobacterium colombiensis]|jgi:hypothetical protein|uniref:Uncharacterized protein n=1 Tax=Candidatus Cetobacterium colombiensis TaxID=3073100 RepID=A0ABU4WAQ2_9FUSO|nr:hypothetical protein [Candidatus Cetobacterium colombiensis]MDX8336097.1 hypothetical protein [Candidatus Cetobacterium colombiensis]